MTKELNSETPSEILEPEEPIAFAQAMPQASIQFQGRGAFIVETTSAGVAVASTVVTEDGRAFALPAIFPNLSYALNQIDELRTTVIRHFDQAAQVGAQIIAEQTAKNAAQLVKANSSAEVKSPTLETEEVKIH